MTNYLVLIYGILVIVGGILGYVKSKSVPSIISGSIFGVLIVGSSLLMFKAIALGSYAALVLSVFLAVLFGFRFKVSRKFMPAGLMIILSLAASITLILAV
ncbi:MAG: TMEM14 family protein, partial [bacterium]